MKKGILIAALFLCCGLFHVVSAAKTNDEVRETLEETFVSSMPESIPLQTALMSFSSTTGLDIRLKLPCPKIEQSVKLLLPSQMSVKNALDYLAKQAGFTWEVNGGCIEITATVDEDAAHLKVISYYIGDIHFLPMALSPHSPPEMPEARILANAVLDYIKVMVDQESWNEKSIVYQEAAQSLMVWQTEENHLLIAKLLREIRAKSGAQFSIIISYVDTDKNKIVHHAKGIGLCGQEITFTLPEFEGERSLEVSPCLTDVSDEQNKLNKPFQFQLPAGKIISVKGIAEKKNGSDVLKLTLSVDGKELETRLFYGSLLKEEKEKEVDFVIAYETADLVKNGTPMNELVNLIKSGVEPASWGEASAQITTEGTKLIVCQKKDIHAQIGDLLVQLSQRSK